MLWRSSRSHGGELGPVTSPTGLVTGEYGVLDAPLVSRRVILCSFGVGVTAMLGLSGCHEDEKIPEQETSISQPNVTKTSKAGAWRLEYTVSGLDESDSRYSVYAFAKRWYTPKTSAPSWHEVEPIPAGETGTVVTFNIPEGIIRTDPGAQGLIWGLEAKVFKVGTQDPVATDVYSFNSLLIPYDGSNEQPGDGEGGGGDAAGPITTPRLTT